MSERSGSVSAPLVVLTTAPDGEVARRLARGLVSSGIVACASLVEGVTSVYRWKGAVEEQAEVLLVLKTTRGRAAELELFLEREHPYDVPECVALAPHAVEEKYLRWLQAETAAGA